MANSSSGASWVYNLPRLNDKDIGFIDRVYAHRLGNIAYIDDVVANLIQRLEDHGMLDNTYIIYTSDNGFHLGNHRLRAGKRCPYEEDINIPLLIRGPDVVKGVTSSIVNSHTDIAPTIFQMLGIPLRDEFDGAPIAYTAEKVANTSKHELVNVEFWNSDYSQLGMAHTQVSIAYKAYQNNTYKALRLISDEYSFLYSTWCNGEHEFYNMFTDQAQMQNRLATPPRGRASSYYGRSEGELFNRLDALLLVTKSCAQESCRNPWAVLFPDGEVGNLTDAMRPEYDSFFTSQPKVSFSSCVQLHIVPEEGPQDVNPFGR